MRVAVPRVSSQSEIWNFFNLISARVSSSSPIGHLTTVSPYGCTPLASTQVLSTCTRSHKITKSSQDFLILRNFVKDWLKSFVHETGQ